MRLRDMELQDGFVSLLKSSLKRQLDYETRSPADFTETPVLIVSLTDLVATQTMLKTGYVMRAVRLGELAKIGSLFGAS